jgi:GT2 family glycosyltransferase
MAGSDYTSFQRTGLAQAVEYLRWSEPPSQELAASIILVNYNGWHDLQRCLGSLTNTLSPDCEVIVVDNCSTDDSPQRISECFPFVRLVRSALNLGFGAGNNLGAKLAMGRALIFLNPDTAVEPGWLEPLVQALNDDPNVGMATPRILLLNDPRRINTCGNDLHVSGLALCRGMGKPHHAGSDPNRQPMITITGANRPTGAAEEQAAAGDTATEPVAAVSGAAFAIQRELFEKIGGFDETFFLYMEDTDLSLRTRIAGYQCVYVPGSIVYHDYELHFGPMKIYYQERNRYLMLLKSLRWPTLLILLPSLLLAEVITWSYVFLHDRQRAHNKLFAYVWVLYWWQQIMEKRRETQLQRRSSDRDLLRMTTARIDYNQADGGWASHLAHLVFDPLFTCLRWTALALVWW